MAVRPLGWKTETAGDQIVIICSFGGPRRDVGRRVTKRRGSHVDQSSGRPEPSAIHLTSIDFDTDGVSVDADNERFDVAHAGLLHKHAEVRHVLSPSARKRLVDVCRDRDDSAPGPW